MNQSYWQILTSSLYFLWLYSSPLPQNRVQYQVAISSPKEGLSFKHIWPNHVLNDVTVIWAHVNYRSYRVAFFEYSKGCPFIFQVWSVLAVECTKTTLNWFPMRAERYVTKQFSSCKKEEEKKALAISARSPARCCGWFITHRQYYLTWISLRRR